MATCAVTWLGECSTKLFLPLFILLLVQTCILSCAKQAYYRHTLNHSCYQQQNILIHAVHVGCSAGSSHALAPFMGSWSEQFFPQQGMVWNTSPPISNPKEPFTLKLLLLYEEVTNYMWTTWSAGHNCSVALIIIIFHKQRGYSDNSLHKPSKKNLQDSSGFSYDRKGVHDITSTHTNPHTEKTLGRHLYNDASYEYGDYCICLHRGDVAFTLICFQQKPVHVIVIIKQYPHGFHMTIVPCARSWYALSKKQQLVRICLDGRWERTVTNPRRTVWMWSIPVTRHTMAN